jgi:hypothetical protein
VISTVCEVVPAVTRILARPAETPVIRPAAVTLAIDGVSLNHVAAPLPLLVALASTVPPMATEAGIRTVSVGFDVGGAVDESPPHEVSMPRVIATAPMSSARSIRSLVRE